MNRSESRPTSCPAGQRSDTEQERKRVARCNRGLPVYAAAYTQVRVQRELTTRGHSSNHQFISFLVFRCLRWIKFKKEAKKPWDKYVSMAGYAASSFDRLYHQLDKSYHVALFHACLANKRHCKKCRKKQSHQAPHTAFDQAKIQLVEHSLILTWCFFHQGLFLTALSSVIT